MLINNWQDIRQQEISFRLLFLIPALVCTALHFVILSLGWQALTRAFGCSLPLRTGIPVWFVTYLGRYIPGKVLFVTGRIMAYTSLGTRVGPTTYATILDNIFHIYAALLAGALSLTWLPGLPLIFKAALLAGAVALSILLLNPWLCNFILKKMAERRGQPSGNVHVPVTFPTLVYLTAVYLSSYIPLTIGLYFFARCFTELPFSHAFWLAGSLGCAVAGGILAVIVPSGLGVREGIFTWLLQISISADIAAVFAIATRIMMTIAELICVGIAVLLLVLQHKALRIFSRATPENNHNG